MATFTLTIPDAAVGRISTAVCRANGYGPVDFNDAVRFTQEHVFKYLARVVIEQDAQEAAQAARDAVVANPDDPLAQALFAAEVPVAGPTGYTGYTGTGPTGLAG